MAIHKLREFLDAEGIKYTTLTHSPAYTAQEVAASAHVPGRELAKTVMVKVDGQMAMAVLPASYKVDFEILKQVTGANRVELATEEEFRGMFPDCEVGAMSPFGNLYGLPVYAARSLADDSMIAFNAGSHTELIQMAYEDFERLVEPRVVSFSARPR